MILDPGATLGDRAVEPTFIQFILSICTFISMISVAALCTTAHCCRRKSKKNELDEPYGIINAGETATADAQACTVAFRSTGLPNTNSNRFSQPVTAQTNLHGRPILQRSSVPLAHPPSPMRRALPKPPIVAPLRAPIESASVLYSAIDKTDLAKRRDQSIPYIEDSINPTYESIDAETDSFSDPLYSKLEMENRNTRKYDYPVFTPQSRSNEEAVYQSASQIYAGGSEDPYSSITSQSGDDRYNQGYSQVGEISSNNFPFDQAGSSRPSTSKDIDQLYSKIQRGVPKRKELSDGPSSAFSQPATSIPFDFAIYPSSESGKTSREPSYRYITVRESVDVIRQRISEREEHAQRTGNRLGGLALDSSGLPFREHFYASIEGGSDYESVSGNAIYEHLPEDLDERRDGTAPSTSRLTATAESFDPSVPPKPPTSPIPSHRDDFGIGRSGDHTSTSYAGSIANTSRSANRTGSALIAGPYSIYSVKSAGTAKLPSGSPRPDREREKNSPNEFLVGQSPIRSLQESTTTSSVHIFKSGDSRRLDETAILTVPKNEENIMLSSKRFAAVSNPDSTARTTNASRTDTLSSTKDSDGSVSDALLGEVHGRRTEDWKDSIISEMNQDKKQMVSAGESPGIPSLFMNLPGSMNKDLLIKSANVEQIHSYSEFDTRDSELPVEISRDEGSEFNHDSRSELKNGIARVEIPLIISGSPRYPKVTVPPTQNGEVMDEDTVSSGPLLQHFHELSDGKEDGLESGSSVVISGEHAAKASQNRINIERPIECRITLDTKTFQDSMDVESNRSYVNSSPGPSSPTLYHVKCASLPTYRHASRGTSEESDGKSQQEKMLSRSINDLGNVFTAHISRTDMLSPDCEVANIPRQGGKVNKASSVEIIDAKNAKQTTTVVWPEKHGKRAPTVPSEAKKEDFSKPKSAASCAKSEEVFQPLIYKEAS